MTTERHRYFSALHCGTPVPVHFISTALHTHFICTNSRQSSPWELPLTLSCVVALTLKAEWQISVHCPHGTPGPEPHRPTAHPPERPVHTNFSIGGERRSDTLGWQRGSAVIGWKRSWMGGMRASCFYASGAEEIKLGIRRLINCIFCDKGWQNYG